MGSGKCEGVAIYDPSMDEAGDAKRSFELDLRNAMTRGELLLHYQPFADAHSRRIRGFEAVLRWQHPEKGIIPPGQFIPENQILAPRCNLSNTESAL